MIELFLQVLALILILALSVCFLIVLIRGTVRGWRNQPQPNEGSVHELLVQQGRELHRLVDMQGRELREELHRVTRSLCTHKKLERTVAVIERTSSSNGCSSSRSAPALTCCLCETVVNVFENGTEQELAYARHLLERNEKEAVA